MEELQKHSSASAKAAGRMGSRLLRYPLRSAAKSKEEKPPLSDASNYSVSATRGKNASSVSKSVSVLDLSGKEKSATPSIRLSVPAKPSVSPCKKLVGNFTPTSEAKSKRSSGSKSDVPVSGVSIRRKFNMLSSATYWQSQIKVSEAAGKHFISLGFFKLALEAECEPIQLLRDELKLYVRRHDLTQFGESVKELSERYGITEEFEQLQVSETCSHVPEEEARSYDDDARSSLPMKSKSPRNEDTKNTHQGKVTNQETAHKNESMTKPRRSTRVDAANSKTSKKSAVGSIKQKKTPKPKGESKKVQDSLKKQGKESASGEGQNDFPSAEHELKENKENADAVVSEDLTELEA